MDAPTAKYRTIRILSTTFFRIQKMAWLSHRTVEAQVDWLLDAIETNKHYEVISVSTLPHPPNAVAIPLTYIAPVEE